MSATVWFTDFSARHGNGLLDKTAALLEKAGGDSLDEVLAHLEATRAAQRRLAGPR